MANFGGRYRIIYLHFIQQRKKPTLNIWGWAQKQETECRGGDFKREFMVARSGSNTWKWSSGGRTISQKGGKKYRLSKTNNLVMYPFGLTLSSRCGPER
jgi:hypothetical protein